MLLPLVGQAGEGWNELLFPVEYTPPDSISSITVTTHLDVVDETDGVVSLREAISNIVASGAEGNIDFALPSGSPLTIFLSNNLPVLSNTSCHINGQNLGPDGGTISIDGGFRYKIFEANHSNLVLDNLTLTHGYAAGTGAAILCHSTTLSIHNCLFLGNRAKQSGGAIYSIHAEFNYLRNRLEISNCSYSNNSPNNVYTDAVLNEFGF